MTPVDGSYEAPVAVNPAVGPLSAATPTVPMSNTKCPVPAS